MRDLAFALTVLAACAPAPQQPSVPTTRVLIVISANAEWKATRPLFRDIPEQMSPYGTWFEAPLGGQRVIFFHGGWGKVSAAGSAQWAIDTFHPELLLNIGTVGGFGHDIAVGDIMMATETIIYDIIERMGDPDEAIADYSTKLDTRAWPARLASRVKPARLISADQDLAADAVDALEAKYHAPVGDWESGAIAYVATHNHVRVMILRAVTDLVTKAGDVTYNNNPQWEVETNKVMGVLVALTADALPDLLAAPRPGN